VGGGPSRSSFGGLEEQYAERAVKADRYDPAALVNKANVALAVRGDVEKARELYREALLSDASCVEAIYNLALVYKRLRRYDDAIQCFAKLNVVLRNDPQVAAAPTTVVGRFVYTSCKRGEGLRAELK